MLALIALSLGMAGSPGARFFPLATTAGLEMKGTATLEAVVFRGKRAVAMTEELDPNGDRAIVKGLDFHNGTIEFDIAGQLTSNAPRGARCFAGIAFRGADDMQRYENFYLRVTNGRALDPMLRAHAVQYCSPPEFTWDVLRKRRPGVFEAHADMELGAWTHVKVWVQGTEAKFYVGTTKEPALTVHGLLMGDAHGNVALWVAGYTKAYFANLKVQPS